MENAKRDENNVPTLLAVLNTDGKTVVPVQVVNDAGVQRLAGSYGSAGDDNGPASRALRDENYVTTLIGVSSADGVTPVAVYCDSEGRLLIDTA